MADQVIIEFVGDTSKLEEAYGKLNEQIAATGSLNKDSATSFQKANADIAASFSSVTDSNKQLNEQLKNLTTVIAGGALKGLIADLNAVEKAQKSGTASAKDLNKQLSVVAETLKGMKDIGKGVSASFEVTASATKLFGSKSEELESIITRVHTAIKILNSLTEIQKVLSIESAAAQTVQNVQLEAGILAEHLQTAALSENVIVSKAATAAQWLLNLAMEANPIGVVVAAIAGLVSALMVFSRESESATDKQLKFNAAQKGAIEIIKTRMSIEKSAADEKVAEAEQNVADLKAQKASTDDIRKAEADLDTQRVTAAQKQIEILGTRAQNFDQYKDQYINKQQQLNTKIAELEKQRDEQKTDGKFHPFGEDFDKEITAAKGVLENLTKEMDVVREANENLNKAMSDQSNHRLEADRERQKESLQLAIETLKLKVALAKQGSQEELNATLAGIKAEAQERIKDIQDTVGNKKVQAAQIALIQAEANKKGLEVQQQYRVANLENAAANIDAENLTIKQGTKEALEAQLDSINAHATAEREKVKNSQNAADELNRIDQKADADSDAARKAFYDKQQADQLAAATILAQARLAVAKKGSQQELKAQQDVINAEHDAEVNAINNSISDAKLRAAEIEKINAETTKKLQDAQLAKNKNDISGLQQNLDAQKTHAGAANDLIQNNPDASTAEKLKAQVAYYDKLADLIKQQEGLELLSYQTTDESLEQYLNKEAALKDAAAKNEQQKQNAIKASKLADEKQIATASINFAKQASDQIFQTINQNRNNRYNAEISTLQKQAAFELNNNNLTQAQKLAIQRKFDKEQASVKLQQWKADQKSKEEQAIINGALAVANIMATMPWTTFGVAQGIAIASAVASTAVSVATIAAQKPPQFAKGTPKGTPVTPAGTKLVGEHGPELIYTPGGERIITAPDTAAILAKYDVPALPNVSPAIAMRANLNHAHPLINEDTLAKKIALEISKQTKPHLTFDKNGFTAHLITRGSKTTILNNKYKL